MRRRVILIIAAVTIAIFIAMFYVNEIGVPGRVKISIIESIERATGRNFLCNSIRFNIFKGIVLERPVIYDASGTLLKAEEASFVLAPLPLLKKAIVIPTLTIKSPTLSLERAPDGSFNISDILTEPVETEYDLIIRKVKIKNGRIAFIDATFPAPFTATAEAMDMEIDLLLPYRVRYNVSFQLKEEPLTRINTSGSYLIVQKELVATVQVKDISPADFLPYYWQSGISIREGRADIDIDLILNEMFLKLRVKGRAKDIGMSTDSFRSVLNGTFSGGMEYGFVDMDLDYIGYFDLEDSSFSGASFIVKVEDVKGRMEFNEKEMRSEKLRAVIDTIPIEAKINIKDFYDPLVVLEIESTPDIAVLQRVMKERFDITLPGKLEGHSRFFLAIEDTLSDRAAADIRGHLLTHDASLIFEGEKEPLEDINGEFRFTTNQLIWTNVSFKHKETDYKTSGDITDFKVPKLRVAASSEDLDFDSFFTADGKLLRFSRLTGRYRDLEFDVEGNIDLARGAFVYADISGSLDMELKYIGRMAKKEKKMLATAKPLGITHADFSLKGNINNIKFCEIEAKVSSDSLSLYGFKMKKFFMNYLQKDGVCYIKSVNTDLYGGVAEASGKIDLVPQGLPYTANLNFRKVKLEKLKTAIGLKGKDISGLLRGRATLKGRWQDTSALTGSGRIVIGDGKLWHLNLFRGLGIFVFTSDFMNVIFKQGSCDFVIRDRAFYADDIKLESDMLRLFGSVRIDFDKTVKGIVKAEPTDEALISGAIRSPAPAIGRYSYIEIAGTLKDPQYKFRPDMGTIVEDLKSRIFEQTQ